MNYKKQLTLLFVGLFLFVLTAILSFIYISYADFRRDEFYERLRQKSFFTVRLLTEVREIDRNLLRIIDQNTINRLYDEKILIFNESNELIYSSLDDEVIPYSNRLIDQIRHNQDKFYVDEDGDEVVGVHYNESGHDYVVLASAYDQYGINKLKNLRNLVILSLVGGTVLIGVSSYFYVRQVFKPIDRLNQSIQAINETNLREFVPVKANRDELDDLARNYNLMLSRLYNAFESQRSFVRNASHELKTPLAIIYGRLERLNELVQENPGAADLLESLMDDVEAQASLVESLLLMQRLQSDLPISSAPVSLDEVLEDAVKEVKEQVRMLDVHVDMTSSITSENQLRVIANRMLLKTCFKNLLSNAGLYATDSRLKIAISAAAGWLRVDFRNRGEAALPPSVFDPFYRHGEPSSIPGSGLGLSIVAQVMGKTGGRVTYVFEHGAHVFSLHVQHDVI